MADGRVVKGTGFEQLRDVGDPVELAAGYDAAGADELVFLNITATVRDESVMTKLVELVADEVSIPFTVGGGVRTVDDAARLIDAGADRVALNSAALADPRLLTSIADRYGAQAVVVAIDVRGDEVFSHAGTRPTGRRAAAWAAEATSAGAGEVLLTSIDADGRQQGYDLATTTAVRGAVRTPVIASGGAGRAEHVVAALAVADAALVASIVHADPSAFRRLRQAVTDQGVALRPLSV